MGPILQGLRQSQASRALRREVSRDRCLPLRPGPGPSCPPRLLHRRGRQRGRQKHPGRSGRSFLEGRAPEPLEL